MLKILIIRFSSIGDIVLTSPIIRGLKTQKESKLHYLVKDEYRIILESNPYVDKIISLKNNMRDVLSSLRNENYDFIIDLQNSARSWWIKFNLRRPNYTVRKKNLEKLLLIYTGLDYLGDHIVDRYFKCISKMGVINDNKGLDYFFKSDTYVNFNLNQKFIAWSIGASYCQKALSSEQIIKTCDNILNPVVLLGGENEKDIGDTIIKKSSNNKIFNFCGILTLDQSAYMIKKSYLVLTNDTGLMHIAASFQKSIISFWGCTKPSLGFYPYMPDNSSIQIVANSRLSPCSKHGRTCRFGKKGCVKQIDYKLIVQSILE